MIGSVLDFAEELTLVGSDFDSSFESLQAPGTGVIAANPSFFPFGQSFYIPNKKDLLIISHFLGHS